MLTESELKSSFKTDDSIDKKSKEIAEDLINKEYDISSFIESLGFALTSTNIEMRVNGTKLLSSTLLKIPIDYLSEFQMNFIVTFYCDRIKDHHNILPSVIDGILALTKMKNIPNGSLTRILQTFFQETTCQSQVRGDRLKIYEIFKTISNSHCKELILMGGDYIYGIINSLDGERDPRNLEFIYKFMPEFMNKFPLLHLSEEMFEVFSCYFPIDFNPSKNDPASITRDNLADLLANCLIAKEEFIEWVVPLALEKLESELIVAKLDSLDLLNRCAKKYPATILEPYFDTIWLGIKAEIFPGSDNQEIHAAGLKTLKTILEKASTITEISKNYQTVILGTILNHLSDANHRLYAPSRSISLVCVTGDPLFATDKILNTLIIKLKSDDCDTEQKIKLLSTISQVLTICTVKSVLKEINSEVLGNLEIELMNIVKDKLNTIEITEVLLNCLVESMIVFNLENRYIVYKYLENILKTESINLERILKRLAKNFSDELTVKLIEPLIKNFSEFSIETMKKLYENLKFLVEFNEFVSPILNLILTNIFDFKSMEILKLTLAALKALIEDQGEESAIIMKLYKDYDIIDKIVKLSKTNNTLPLDILGDISIILNIFIRKLPKDEQKKVMDKYIPQMQLNLACDLFLTKGILGFMHENINNNEYFESLLSDLTNLSLVSDDEILRKAAHHLICSLLNKMDDNEMNKTVIRKLLEKIKLEIKKENHKAVELLSWISKGLIVRGYTDAGEIIETIAELLNHPTLSKTACLGFEIISMEFPELHLPVVKFLFKQKLFHIVLNYIGQHLLAYSEYHLNAFIFILRMTPHKVLKLNIEKIGPILFKCLEMDKPSTILIALDINKNFLKEKDEYFRTHLNHLIPEYLKLTQYKESMKIRISALECLEAITQYPTYIILPLKTDVVLSLSSALDDHKRLVRNTAVKARNLWCLIGSPNGE